MKGTMQRMISDLRTRLVPDASTRQLVLAAAVSMILIQLALRAWVVYGSWFYGDDLKFLSEAATTPLSVDYLFTRHQQQLMPGGLLISWLVGQGPAYPWGLAATSIMIMQALASAACLLMLTRLFGWRPAILIPLGLYLFSPLTLGAFVWWAAALNQLPLQIAFFGLICTHVAYIRTRRLRWAGASAAVLVIGLLFYIKAVVMIPVVVLLTLLYFVDGRPVTRIMTALRRFWPVWVAYALAGIGYLGAYVATGSSPVSTGGNAAYLETMDRQLRQTLGPTLVGGPWRWLDQGRQDVLAHAPEFAITIAWIVLTFVVVATMWRWVGAWRSWTILAVYLIPTTYLTASGRTVLFGPDVGLYVRYLSDVVVVACLVLALAIMPLRGEGQRRVRTLSPSVSVRPLVAVGVLAFLIGSVASTISYAKYWHLTSPAEAFITAATQEIKPLERVDIIDQPVPDSFVLAPNAPFNRPSRLLAPLETRINPVTSGTDLRMFSPGGTLQPAVVTPGVAATISGDSDCGVLVEKSRPTRIPLSAPVTADPWWISIGYLASSDGTLSVQLGDQTPRTLPVLEGPHTLFVKSTGAYDDVFVRTSPSDLGVCVDNLTVGFIGTFS